MKTGTDRYNMEKLVKQHMHVQYHKKRLFEKELSQVTVKQLAVFFLRMIAFKTHLDLIAKFKWIGKVTHNILKQGLANTMLC